MGFTPLEGLAMATRSGNVDPGLVLWLIQRGHLSPAEVSDGLEHGSGLVGLAGTSDMRAVITRAARGDADARLALDVYVHRLVAGVAAMAASTGGLDALVFTGGVGEHAAAVREGAARGLAHLGVGVDAAKNTAAPEAAAPDHEITAAGSAARTWVIEAREDLEIAGQVRAVIGT